MPAMRSIRLGCVVLLLFVCFAAHAQNGQQQFAQLGDFKLLNGDVIRNCRIGYRTFGTLNAEKSNAILFPSWAGGTTPHSTSSG